MNKPTQTLQVPSSPDPVPVALNPATTALLIFDVVDPICERFPISKTHMAPVIAALLARARKAGVTVAYGTRAHHKSHWLAEVAPTPGDIQIENQAQDRFYNTDLDKMLKAKGITTLILVGWKVSGSVTYTSVGATLRGYTVVVPDRCEPGRHGFRDRRRAAPDPEPEQRECRQRAVEGQGLDLEPHGFDRVQIARRPPVVRRGPAQLMFETRSGARRQIESKASRPTSPPAPID